MGGSQQKHDWLTYQLYREPSYLGLENILSKNMEYPLEYNNRLYTIVDLHFQNYDRNIMIEVKSGNHINCFTKGIEQLKKIRKYHDRVNLMQPEVYVVMPNDGTWNDRWLNILKNLDIYSLRDIYNDARKTIKKT